MVSLLQCCTRPQEPFRLADLALDESETCQIRICERLVLSTARRGRTQGARELFGLCIVAAPAGDENAALEHLGVVRRLSPQCASIDSAGVSLPARAQRAGPEAGIS